MRIVKHKYNAIKSLDCGGMFQTFGCTSQTTRCTWGWPSWRVISVTGRRRCTNSWSRSSSSVDVGRPRTSFSVSSSWRSHTRPLLQAPITRSTTTTGGTVAPREILMLVPAPSDCLHLETCPLVLLHKVSSRFKRQTVKSY